MLLIFSDPQNDLLVILELTNQGRCLLAFIEAKIVKTSAEMDDYWSILADFTVI